MNIKPKAGDILEVIPMNQINPGDYISSHEHFHYVEVSSVERKETNYGKPVIVIYIYDERGSEYLYTTTRLEDCEKRFLPRLKQDVW